ncbi:MULTISPECIES: MadR family response regulator transcription factor [Gordonia]|uniref:Putative two-component response regulator n=1 Tax=Gordonia sputi NBRC 100414 TaxID=1089453 RepID=H5U082_9ACTN|nr:MULTISPECIES: response regulator transcription factor [Gordonia]NKY95377.1 response regulator transcription factor [Gordonia sputi]OBA43659.1 DNA-binding response regulator [Gordonia sp. 852002-51296_SCH5728562-b]OBA66694.1 DNA-binding response regulator [Gordonia sp. 852002-10350_SCH5691597]GAB39140.1 putative two-component response regulator [Gordonia sputi NBRC 100414]
MNSTEVSTGSIRAMLVDDHALLRAGIRSLLEREDTISVVGEAGSFDHALAEVARCRPDVVVVDLKLTAGTEYEGLRLITEIAQRHSDVASLVLTTFLDDDLVVRAVKAGARGYVVKDVDTTELVRAIQAVSGGGSAFDPRSAAIVLRTVSGGGESPEALTEREREVLRLLADGLSNKRIGETLFISESTVKFHIRNIIRKLGVTKRTDAVYIASKRGLI